MLNNKKMTEDVRNIFMNIIMNFPFFHARVKNLFWRRIYPFTKIKLVRALLWLND